MDIKNLTNIFITFANRKLLEFFGIIFVIMGILLFIALISYSPNDPNFIFRVPQK